MVVVERYTGDRTVLAPLLALADDSESALATYRDAGEVFVARDGDRSIVGQLVLVPVGEGVVELKNMAVDPATQGLGVGRALVDAAVAWAAEQGFVRMTVATGMADVGNLRFYQRVGFRGVRIERDVFTPANGYAESVVDGIELRDQIWFDRPL